MAVLDGKSRDQYNDYPTERKKRCVYETVWQFIQ